jgi:DNA-binding transcriptional ArsR family regulator
MHTNDTQTLEPTFWRTCRVLANRKRLTILQLLLRDGEQNVQQVARSLRQPIAVTSQYLRMLNARGIIQARRNGRWVFYRVGANKNIPSSVRLARALQKALADKKMSITSLYRIVTTFTHPRRIVIVRCLADMDLTKEGLHQRTNISRMALARHLQKLVNRGYIKKHQNRRYSLVRPPNPFAHMILMIALQH